MYPKMKSLYGKLSMKLPTIPRILSPSLAISKPKAVCGKRKRVVSHGCVDRVGQKGRSRGCVNSMYYNLVYKGLFEWTRSDVTGLI